MKKSLNKSKLTTLALTFTAILASTNTYAANKGYCGAHDTREGRTVVYFCVIKAHKVTNAGTGVCYDRKQSASQKVHKKLGYTIDTENKEKVYPDTYFSNKNWNGKLERTCGPQPNNLKRGKWYSCDKESYSENTSIKKEGNC